MGSFDSWDDWDDDFSDTGTGSQNQNTGGRRSSFDDDYGNQGGGDFGGSGGSRKGGSYPVPRDEDQYGVRPQGPGRGGYTPPAQQTSDDSGVYVIRSISEVPLSGQGALSKIFRGIPFTANNQINISLQEAGSLGHGGGAINGIIYGKIENQALGPGMRVKIRGTVKRGQIIIKDLYDVDSGGLPIGINPYWVDPMYQQSSSNRRGNPAAMAAVLAVIAILAVAFFLLRGGIDPSTLNKIKIAAIIIGALVFIKVFNINIFNNSFVQKVILIVVLCAIALYVPGGDSVMVCAIMIFGLYIMLKGIIK